MFPRLSPLLEAGNEDVLDVSFRSVRSDRHCYQQIATRLCIFSNRNGLANRFYPSFIYTARKPDKN